MEISRQEHWSGLSFASAGDLPDPGIAPSSLSLLHWQRILYHCATWEALPYCLRMWVVAPDSSAFMAGRRSRAAWRGNSPPLLCLPSAEGKGISEAPSRLFPLTESHENPSYKGGWESKYSVVPASVVRGRQKEGMLLTCWVSQPSSVHHTFLIYERQRWC